MQISVVPPLINTISRAGGGGGGGGGDGRFTGKKECESIRSLLRALATRTPSLGRCEAHTISKKLVSKVSAQKKGGKVMTAQICVQMFVVSGPVPP